MQRMLLAAAAAAVLAFTPHASAGAVCISADAFSAGVSERSTVVAIIVIEDIKGLAAKAVTARLNATPPETAYAADRILVLGARSIETNAPAPYVIAAFFDKGCLTHAEKADPVAAARALSPPQP